MPDNIYSSVLESDLPGAPDSRYVLENVEQNVGSCKLVRGATGEKAMELDCLEKADAQINASAVDQLFELQVAQFKHDEFYHREIARLSVHGRLNHMALHFCKYVGQLVEAVASGDAAKIRRSIVDTFIIDLCAANALNVRISGFMRIDDAATLDEFAKSLVRTSLISKGSYDSDLEWLVSAFAIESGKIAKACEKIDHLEGFPFRDSITHALARIAEVCLIASERQGFSLADEVRKRLFEVEEKFIFHRVF